MSAGALAAGVALAVGAACCFDGAVALQALEARAVEEDAVGAGLVRRLLARPRWLAATALAAAGWPLQVAALTLAPLTVVQPALATGLILLLVLGVRLLHEPARPADALAVGAIAAGLALLAWAAPHTEHVHAGAAGLVAVLLPLGLAAGVPWALQRRLPGRALVAAAGCGYAAAGLTSALLADALSAGSVGAVVGWAAITGLVAVLGLADEMGALQRVAAARVAAGAFAVQVVVPVLCAPILVHEGWGDTPGSGAVVLLGLSLVVGGALALGATPAVRRLLTGAQATP